MIEDKVSNLIYSHYDVTFECVSVHIRVLPVFDSDLQAAD